ncbi:hypothetical protein [Timonella senegalensis]|uniref:hypothetical protein n=1 Tax=Timonella senegalensis TaxID=1465825 RepID=UPI0028ACFB79|nr:hypothetical protein [Timonella senegalensis]
MAVTVYKLDQNNNPNGTDTHERGYRTGVDGIGVLTVFTAGAPAQVVAQYAAGFWYKAESLRDKA